MPVLPILEKPGFADPTGGGTPTGGATNVTQNATQKTRFLHHPQNVKFILQSCLRTCFKKEKIVPKG